MGRISSVHRQTLFEIAREAYGSGLTEGSRGGRGYMGLNEDFEHKYQGREKTCIQVPHALGRKRQVALGVAVGAD